MQVNLIPLRSVAYSDRNAILTAYSRELGRVSCLIPAGNGREARRRRALMMPMMPIQCELTVKPGQEIYPMKDVMASPPLPGLSSDPVKASVALFLAEVLLKVLRQSESEPQLFDFVRSSAIELAQTDKSVANFHIYFLLHLLDFLGVAPDLRGFRFGMLFDMTDGCFRPTAPLHGNYLEPTESAAAAQLARISSKNYDKYQYTRSERARVLDVILEYYSLHISQLSGLKSLEVLHQIF